MTESRPGMSELGDRCARCGEIGEDRRTLWMACFYAMHELDVPFEETGIITVESGPKSEGDITGTQLDFPSGKAFVTHNKSFYTLSVCKDCRAEWMTAIEEWFKEAKTVDKETLTGVFVRRNGTNVELTEEQVEQWKLEHGGAEPARLKGEDDTSE